MEAFLEWAKARPHPSTQPPSPLPDDLDQAVRFTWQHGSGIKAERDRRMKVLLKAADLY